MFNIDILNENFNEESFSENGYLTFPAAIKPNVCESLKNAIDELEVQNTLLPIEHPALADILIDNALQKLIRSAMGNRNYTFHHLHAARHSAGTRSLGWHHDYEQNPSRDRTGRMIHVFLYLNGLNGTIGNLLLLPGSHKLIVSRYFHSDKKLDFFENKITVNNLPHGSMVFINSALLHAREAMPGGERSPRYFVDMAFCQEGVIWPPYLETGDWRRTLRDLQVRYATEGESTISIFNENAFRKPLKDHLIETLRLRPTINKIRKSFLGNQHKRLL